MNPGNLQEMDDVRERDRLRKQRDEYRESFEIAQAANRDLWRTNRKLVERVNRLEAALHSIAQGAQEAIND